MINENQITNLGLEKNFVSAVVYVRNHEDNIDPFLRGLVDTLHSNFEKYEIIFVNDYSTDMTVEKIKSVAKQLTSTTISLINLSFHQGLETAIVAGVDIAIGDFVFEFDSPVVDYDFQLVIMHAYHQSLKGFDIVSMSPERGERFSSKIFYRIFQEYSRNHVQLSTERFRILSRRAINRINMLRTSIPYRKAIYFNCGLRAANLKYKTVRNLGADQITEYSAERIELAVNCLILFTNVGAKVALYMSVVMFLFSLFAIGYTVYVFLTFSRIVEGWTTMMLFTSVAFTGMFALLAVLIKYTSLILSMQHIRHHYVYESVDKLN